MDEFDSVVTRIIRALLERGALGVVVIVAEPDGQIYSQWAIPKGMDTEGIGRVFDNISSNRDPTFH